MNCPGCGSDSAAYETYSQGIQVFRRRKCLGPACERRFATVEEPISYPISFQHRKGQGRVGVETSGPSPLPSNKEARP